MDEEVDSDNESVNGVLAQESSELFTVLSSQSSTVIMKLLQMIPDEALRSINHPSTSAAATVEHIKTMLEYFSSACAVDCCNFLQSVCMLCENIPMHLESRLISVAGCEKYVDENSTLSAKEEKFSLSPSEGQLVKRPRIDHWERYISSAMSLLLSRWEQLSECLVSEVSLENVWVNPRAASRGRDRPDQTPADRESRTPDPYGDYGSMEPRVTLEMFLQESTGKVTVLVGQSGSGKTLLMSNLGQQWARGLGPVRSSSLFILLEFRQLKLISRPVSLSELLFRNYLPSSGGNDEKIAVMDYLLSNPKKSWWVLDGYDDFHNRLTKKELKIKLLDPEKPLPIADLISGLLNRQLLPGCTVVITCHAPCRDLESVSDKMGHLQGWDSHDIKEYVHNYFEVKGYTANQGFGMQAVDLLLTTQHLLGMSTVPALCNICCICLEHLLLQGKEAGKTHRMRTKTGKEIDEHLVAKPGRDKEDDGSREWNLTQRGDKGGRRESEGTMMGSPNSAAQLPPLQAQIPSTLTQVYLTVLGALLSHDPDKRGSNDTPKTMTLQQSTVYSLRQYQSKLCELSQLAWRGLEGNNTLFMEEDLSKDVLNFSVRTGLFSKVELRREDGTLGRSYSFSHLTLHEFLAALRIMSSQDVSDQDLQKRLNLKTRWITKSDQRTAFDSLPLFICGLSSPHCTPALVQLAGTSACAGGQAWVSNRQALVLKQLKKLCLSSTLTGPKLLELCHCVQESQDHQLAQQVVATRPTLELRNIRLLPNDINALAFVVNSVGDYGVGLNFGACSLEMECLDVLPRCQYIQSLCFRSRKYGDKFAEKLSSILPKFKTLRKLKFCGASLTATGAANLASALQKCPDLCEINLSGNNLQDNGIEHIADVFAKLSKLNTVMLGQNNSTLKAVDYLIRKMSSCLNIQDIHTNGMKEVTVTFSQNSDLNCHNPTISLLNQKWSKPEMKKLAASLANCPSLSVLDLSGGEWDAETLKTLTQFLPRFNITKKIIMNDSCCSVDILVILTHLMSECAAVMELRIRLQSPVQVSIDFSGGREASEAERSKILCLSCCDLLPADLDKVWRSLGTSSDLTLLDVSSNCLGNKGLRKLLDFLPCLSRIQEINASNNGISMEGVVMLAEVLCSHNNLTEVHISCGGREELLLKFCPDKSQDKPQLKIFRINNSSLSPSIVTKLCRKLVQCLSPLELDLSHSSLTDEGIKNLMKVLPKMMSLQRLNVGHSITSTAGALTLIRSLTVSQRVTSVELRPQTESFILLDNVNAKHIRCRLTHFSLNAENLERMLEILRQVLHLSDLDLSSNQLKDEGVKRFLDSLPELKIARYVNLSNNSLTQQGLLDVANTLSTCGNVSGVEVSLGDEEKCLIWFVQYEGCEKTLSIRESSLEWDHLARLAEIVSVCPRLTKIEFKNSLLHANLIGDFVKLLNSFEHGFTVSIDESWIRSEEAVSLVCRCLDLNRNIQTIKVHSTTLQLSLMKSAQRTAVSEDSADLPMMATEKIGLIDCAVEGLQLASLTSIIQKCPSLTELDFSHNRLGSAKGNYLDRKFSEALLQATSIQRLNLSGHVIDDAAAQIIIRTMPRLRSLNLSHCVWPAPVLLQLIKVLGECVDLEELCLDSLQVNEDTRVCLTHSLRSLNSLRSLLLEGWRMADRGVEQLISILPAWTELRKISLSNNLISDQSGDRLIEALNSCRHLEELYVSRNSLGDATAARMALVLPSLTHITVLDLSENRVGPEGSVSLSKAIMCLKNLTKIRLTSVGTSELCAVAASLAHCPAIQDVGLGWNCCGDKVAVELARVIPLCQKLTRIDLESNSVSVVGAEALVRALQPFSALQIIRLWKNQVSHQDADRLILRDRRLNFSPT